MDARRASALAALCTCALPGLLFAQSVTPGELNQAGRLGEQLLRERQQIEEERQRERDRQRQLPAGQALPETQDSKAVAPAAAAVPNGECLQVRSLDLVGARLLPEEKKASLAREVVDHCVGTQDLNALLRRITDSYVSLGYVTTRAYVPPQDTQNGRLTIVVVEGTIERIEIEPRGSVAAATAFPDMVGHVFNLRAAEQGMDQLNRLSTNDARLDIRPGSTPGASVLVIANQSHRRVTGSFASDNTGSPETGEWQGTASVVADDLFGLNDNLVLSHTRAIDDPVGPAASHSTALSYFVPYGWWTGSLTLSDSDYASLVQGATRSFVTSGTSRNVGLRVDRVAYRDQSRKLTLYAGLTRRDSKNYIADVLIDASSRALTVLDLQSNLSIAHGGALWSFDAGLSHGLTFFDALNDPVRLPGGVPRAQFTKLTAGASVARGFQPGGVRLQLTSALSAQWANDVLYASEQMSLVGPFSVRGYRDVRLYGDRGFTWRNELAFPFSLNPIAGSPLVLRPFVGADFGRVFPHESAPAGYLSGWATGLNAAFAPVSLQLSWSGAAWRSHTLPADHLFFARVSVSL